jgi:CRISPR/Cas system-associated exonuclease Cas4 (RecB family)
MVYYFDNAFDRRIAKPLAGSLDSFLHDPTDVDALGEEERKAFESWVSKILANPLTISSMVEQALHEGMHSEWEEDSLGHKFKLGSYYPSMIERCLRSQAYSYLFPEPPTKEELAIYREGRAIHELIALSLRRSGLISIEGSEVIVDLVFNEEAKLHGRIDDLLLIRLADEGSSNFKLFVPLEIKSTQALPEEPKQTHYYQLSTYLLAKKFPMGVLLYWAKRAGEVKAFPITRDDVMYSVLRERVFELHEALKKNDLPQKEASRNRDYIQCDRCGYADRCNPFLVESIQQGSKLSLFDIDSILLDPLPRRKAALRELGLPTTMRPFDIDDEETRETFWDLFNSPKFVELDELIEPGRSKVYEQVELGRVPVGISSSRHDVLLEATRARLANLGISLPNLILRESSNYDTDLRFKVKWAQRLARNYEVVEYFDRDAATSSMVLKSILDAGEKKSKKDVATGG